MFSPPSVIPYTALPDYKPPFAMSSMRGDEDGNLWIRINQMRPVAGTWLYDIVNRQGELFDRIQMPIARTLVGYGSGNIVYTLSRTPEGVKLERVRWKP
jgi:sugar lactone lactonase YvrE